MPVDHNGSARHKRYKSKMANILRRYGYIVFGDRDDEIAIRRNTDAPPYYVDICAVSGSRIIIVEISGYRGHKSTRQILHDTHRTNYIKKVIKNSEIYTFAFWQLKKFDEMVPYIIQELKLE